VGTWFAGWQVSGLSIEVLHQDVGDEADEDWAEHSWAGSPAADGVDHDDDEFGIYRGNGSGRQRDGHDYRGAGGYDSQDTGYRGDPAGTGFRDAYPNEAGHLNDGPLYRDEAEYPDEGEYPGDAEYPEETGSAPQRPLYRDGTGYPGDADYPSETDYSGMARQAGGDRDAQASLYGQIAIYTLTEDRVDEFDRLTRRVVRQVRAQEPDTLVYIVHAVPSAPMQRILYEVYRDRTAYEQHKRQPYVVAFEADRRPLVLATNIIELGLQQAKVSPLPSVSDLLSDTGFDLLSDTGFGQPGYGPRPGGSAGGVGGRHR
jgi:quinol monooxygenase YgiN